MKYRGRLWAIALLTGGAMCTTSPAEGKGGSKPDMPPVEAPGDIRPLSQSYIACAGATVTMGFRATEGVVFRWYDVEEGGSPIPPATDSTLVVVKGSYRDIGEWWVEPVHNGVPDVRIRVRLESSANCGLTSPMGCSVNGTLLFKEDFGGNSDSDPQDGAALPVSVISYNYKPPTNATPNDGEYVLTKQAKPMNTWYSPYDHTWPGINRGYLLQVNAGVEPGQFYRYRIDGLCSGYRLYFSTWLASLCNVNHPSKTNHLFILEDTDGHALAQYYTGDVPDADPAWKNYGFEFTVPEGQSSIVLRIINNGPGGNGNDFVMDDIEIRFCAPSVERVMPVADEVCYTSGLVLMGSYTDDGTFGDELVYQWEYSLTGDVNTPSDWLIIPGATGTVTGGSLPAAVAGLLAEMGSDTIRYFRLLVANGANINNVYCRAMSQTVKVNDCLRLHPDTVEIWMNQPVEVDVLANDYFSCEENNLTSVSISLSLPPAHGMAVVRPADRMLLYTPDAGWYGVDSLRYVVEDCHAMTDSTVVYIKVSIQTMFHDTICQYGSYSGNGFVLPVQEIAGEEEFRKELINTHGSDSIVILYLRVHSAYYDTIVSFVCQNERYRQYGFDVLPAGLGMEIHSQAYTTAYGCDSLIHLQLTVYPTYEQSVHQTVYEDQLCYFEGQTYNAPGEYSVLLQTANGCDSIRILHLTVLYYPPEITAFSPFNGDGINDYLYPGFRIQVFNRYGAMVYESKTEEQIHTGWNGRNNKGAEVEPGLYFYILYTSSGIPYLKSSVEVLKR